MDWTPAPAGIGTQEAPLAIVARAAECGKCRRRRSVEYLSFASDIIGVSGALFAGLAWWQSWQTVHDLQAERKRLDERIAVALVLRSNGQRRVLPLALRRRGLARAELLGRIGMLPMREAGRRFSLSFLASAEFLAQLDAAQAASGAATITIPCSDEEFQQFAAER
jgi:hypothetical protein